MCVCVCVCGGGGGVGGLGVDMSFKRINLLTLGIQVSEQAWRAERVR